jgi:GntR family transcriptional regulator/MocR family aminotransferase
MRAWNFPVQIQEEGLPLFLAIARAVTDDIRRGRLRPGDPLPGSRTLAVSLGVHRNTVLAAYRELESEGWLVTRPAGGTFVSAALPDAKPRRFAPSARAAIPPRAGFDLGAPLPHEDLAPPLPKGTLTLSGGQPDVRLLPSGPLARAYRRVLRTHGSSLLNYGDPRGHLRLRRALSAMLSAARGVACDEDTLLVVRGSQMALDLTARALISTGDVVAVEALGYRPAWLALQLAGAEIAPIPVDGEGLRVDLLARLCAERRVRALYLTPHHQYPTTVGLAAARRLQLLALARAHRLAIIEDDYDNEFHYEGRPTLPLASADEAGVVVYIGTLSKILAPGLRLGFVAAPRPLIDRLATLRMTSDRQGDQAVECAVAELVEDGEVQRHARRMRRIYQARRDLFAELLKSRFGDRLRFDIPAGGMALWVHAPSIDVEAWSLRARDAGVMFYAGRRFAFDHKNRPYARLGFAALSEPELREAVRRMASAL